MEADIKLDENLIICEATDIILDAPERRHREGGYRRALVHGFEDELVLNYNRDYPGGITLVGNVRLADLEPPKQAPSSHPEWEKIEWSSPIDDLGLHAQISVEPDVVQLFEKADRADLIATIRALRTAVLSMDRRLKALETSS